MYAQGLRAYTSGKSFMPLLQLYVTLQLKAEKLNVITSLTAGFHLYACLKDLVMVRNIEHWSNVQ